MKKYLSLALFIPLVFSSLVYGQYQNAGSGYRKAGSTVIGNTSTETINNDSGLPVTVTNISDLMTDAPAEGDEVTLLMNSNLYTFDLTANPLQICYGYTSDYTAAIGDIIKAVYDGTKWIVTLPIGSDDITTLGTITTGTWVSGHILASSLGTPPFTITNLSNPIQFEERVIYFDVAGVTLDLTANSNMICYERNQDYISRVGDKARFFYDGSKWVVKFEHLLPYAEDHTQHLGANDTNENTVWSCTLRGGDLGVSRALRITTLFSSSGSTAAKTLRVKFGGTNYLSFSTGANQPYNVQTLTIIRNRGVANSQIGFISGSASSYTASTSNPITSAVDTTQDVTIAVTVQKTTGTDTAALESVIVEKL